MMKNEPDRTQPGSADTPPAAAKKASSRILLAATLCTSLTISCPAPAWEIDTGG